MARPLLHIPDGWYHVMSRGNGGEALFRVKRDRYIHLNPVRVGGLGLSKEDQRRAKAVRSIHCAKTG